MAIVIAGGTGFLGRALVAHLGGRHDVRILTRHPRPGHGGDVAWTPDGTVGSWSSALEGARAVINLAGENIAGRRWTAARKAALRDSRLHATRSLAAAIRGAEAPPRLFVSASGVGYYGFRGDEILDEEAAAGTDFLATLCVDWERAAQEAGGSTPVAILRNGLVLHPSGGALKRMLPAFRLGLGGPFASGRQYFSWIHLEDWLALVTRLIDTPAEGVFNATAPAPVTNRAFAHALGAALHRPAVLPVPAFALRLALGELADTLITGQRAVPSRAEADGFRFQYPTIERALRIED